MKTLNLKLRLFILIPALFLFTTNIFSQTESDTTNKFPFVIIGYVTNGNNVELSFYIPGKNEFKQTTKIKNGKFVFQGYADRTRPATIFFEKAVRKYKGERAMLHLFVEKDTVILKFNVEKDKYAWYLYDSLQFLKGRTNLFYQESSKKFEKAVGDIWFFSDPHKNDSMQKYVYPVKRKKMLESYEDIYYLSKYNIVSLDRLKRMVQNKDVFGKNILNDEEKETLLKFFEGLDVEVYNTEDYKIVKREIEEMTSGVDRKGIPKFKNYTLPDINGNIVDIEKVIKSNKVTVLDFWWTGCGPCRKFNKETVKVYKKLKENGIEIISINIDRIKDWWKTSSEKDGIEWTNLNAGYKSEIVAYYNIRKYPTMLIFDNNLNLLGVDVRDPMELLEFIDK